MRRALLVLALVPFLMGQRTRVMVLQPASGAPPAAAWQTPVSDNFDRSDEELGASANWTETVGDSQIISNEADWNDGSNSTGIALWDTDQLAAKQCACVQRSNPVSSNSFCGVAVRFDSLSSTTVGYTARWTRNVDNNVHLRSCSDVSCSTIETWGNEINGNNWLCMCVDGAGSATEFAMWERSTDPSAEDPTDWGDAGMCVCGADTTCTLWTACAATTAEDSTQTYRDCSGDNCYAGIYNGDAASDCEQDSWSARDYQ